MTGPRGDGGAGRPYATLQGVDRAFAILDALARRPMTASGVCETLGLSWTTAHRALANLQAGSAVERDPESGLYRVGPRLHALGQAYLRDHRLVQAGATPLRALARNLGASAQLNERDGLETSVLMAVDHKLEVIPKSTTEFRFPLNAGSNGHVLLAFSAPAVLERLAAAPLLRVTAATETDVDRLAERLRHVRAVGYAITSEDILAGSGSVAAPVLGARGELVGAVCAIVDAAALEDRAQELAAAVRDAARDISRSLGWSPDIPPAAVSEWEEDGRARPRR